MDAVVPASLKAFLTAVAIFDDIGAVLIIGVFYGEELSLAPLALAGLGLGGLVILSIFRVDRAIAYIVIGLFLWVAMLKSGIEASLAGILIAFAIPMRVSRNGSSSPLRETERRLHPFVVLVVVPLFAFFNAGISITGDAAAAILTSAPLGIVAGLLIGKQVGVFGVTWLVVRFGICELPRGVSWLDIYGASVLAGIGFTMSLFVATLAFSDTPLVAASKLAILIGSGLSAVVGVSVLLVSANSTVPHAQRQTRETFGKMSLLKKGYIWIAIIFGYVLALEVMNTIIGVPVEGGWIGLGRPFGQAAGAVIGSALLVGLYSRFFRRYTGNGSLAPDEFRNAVIYWLVFWTVIAGLSKL